MYDALKGCYTFPCPSRGSAGVRLSSFRRVERLPGPAHPAVFRIGFSCSCGDEHVGLIAHDELDWAPLGLQELGFVNLMTDRVESVAGEFGDLAARRIGAGDWPWIFFCYAEERPRPMYPSVFQLLAPAAAREWVGVAIRCPACNRVSINLVTAAHVDVPFHHDREIGVVEHVFAPDAQQAIEEFRAELYSSSFDARRLLLD